MRYLALRLEMGNTVKMEAGQNIIIISRLVLGALASFLAIMLWSRTRDAAWILVIIGTILAYVDTVYSILLRLGLVGVSFNIGSISFLSILLPGLPTVFFIAALSVMVLRKYRLR